MNPLHDVPRPFDVDSDEYPFADRWLAYHDGCIHYIDEGHGPVVLLLHGNPTWSYLYRNIIKELRGECRLVAPDYPGFGMSTAPSGYTFTPQEHAQAIEEFIHHLDLKNFVLVLQDWGGPIGLSSAVKLPERIRGAVIMNTWAWPANSTQKMFSLAMGGWPFGYWLQTSRNFFARTIVIRGIHQRHKHTNTLKHAYTAPFPTPKSRKPTWIFPGQIRKAKKWLSAIEDQLHRLSHIPVQIVWATQDPFYDHKQMVARWRRHFPNSEVELLHEASHYLQEDRPDRVAANIRTLLERLSNEQPG